MEDYSAREDPSVAAPHLRVALKRGTFVLLLGAGVSRGVGLPGWAELVERCSESVGVPFDGGRLTAVMDEVYDRAENQVPPVRKEDIVRSALYQGIDATNGYSVSNLRAPLLVGLGAVVMSGARNGSTEIFTLNFDDVLEAYLVAHGFAVQVITSEAFDIRGDVDVHVYHPHGYLPMGGGSSSSDLVLSQAQFVERLSNNTDEPWPASLLSHLYGRTAIAIGLSFSDENLLQLCGRARRHLKRPIGYSLNVHNGTETNRLRRYGFVPVQFTSHDQIPDYLLNIARATAECVNV